ncbi:MAG: hypothetical protein ACRD0U_11730 [Acidimicrobiales bacterium]
MTARPAGHRLRLALALTAALAAAGCGSGGGAESEPSTGTTGSADRPQLPQLPQLPAGSEAIAIQYTTGGGITGPCCSLWDVPEITAYGDGRVVFVEGTVGQVPGMRQATVPRADLIDLLGQAGNEGLLEAGGPDTGPLCCDLAYTRVILAETYEFSVMGLGFEHEGDDLSGKERQARRAVARLRDQLRALANDSAEYGAYAPDELAVLVFPGSGRAGAEPTPWPLVRSLADGGIPTGNDGRCLHITNLDGTEDARAVLAAGRRSTGSSWSSAGQEWEVTVRPLLPHEHGC